MSLLTAVPGNPFDGSPLARMLPGGLPVPAALPAPAAQYVGSVFIPVPGGQGLPGSVAGSLPWAQVTDRPALASSAELTAVRAELLAAQSYTQTFSSASVVVVSHGLGRYPSVTVLDSAGTEWETEVTHDSTMQLTVRMTAPFSGRVTCN